MHSLRTFTERILTVLASAKCKTTVPSCGIKYFAPPPNYDDIVMPEKPKLRVLDKTPMYPPSMKPPKMQKRLRYMRGPELIHNTLLHKQYGIAAITGGRLRIEHLEMARLTIARKLDAKRMFAIWRVDPPWQPVTKKSQGMRMGGGKGAIDHYVTPVKGGRIILEVGGKCEIWEVRKFLESIIQRLPFKSRVVTQTSLEYEAQKEKELEENNINKYTLKYVIKNNMGGCHKWLSPVDHKWFGKYN